jgi:hypothetical protein
MEGKKNLEKESGRILRIGSIELEEPLKNELGMILKIRAIGLGKGQKMVLRMIPQMLSQILPQVLPQILPQLQRYRRFLYQVESVERFGRE